MERSSKSFQFLKGERYVIGVETPMHGARQVLQVMCTSKDGSIYAAFPYAKLGPGVVGIAEIPAGQSHSSVKVGQRFPATIHSVKYAHHPTGRAHFSLDGKVYTKVLRNAAPLEEINGHMFSVMVQGLASFKKLDLQGPKKTGRSEVLLSPVGRDVSAVKILAHLYRKDRLPWGSMAQLPNGVGFAVRNPAGAVLPGMLLLTAIETEGIPWFMLVTAETIPRFNVQAEAFMSFYGGFDHEDIAFDHSRSLECLMFFYPHLGSFDEAVAQAGCIDIA